MSFTLKVKPTLDCEPSLFFFQLLVATRLREYQETRETRAAAQEEKRETARTARANEISGGLTTQIYDWLMQEALTTNRQQSKPLTS